VGVSVASVLLLWAVLHAVRSSTSFLGGALTDRIGPARTMWLGWAAYALIATGFSVVETAAQAWMLFLALGVVAGLTESPERALVAKLAGARQGSGFGAYHGVTGLAALVGGVTLGAVFQTYGATPAFLASAGAAGALVVGWPVLAARAAHE
jgi:nitrate/nitrite transporter NarK